MKEFKEYYAEAEEMIEEGVHAMDAKTMKAYKNFSGLIKRAKDVDSLNSIQENFSKHKDIKKTALDSLKREVAKRKKDLKIEA